MTSVKDSLRSIKSRKFESDLIEEGIMTKRRLAHLRFGST